ncbi:interferon-related developmental regulator 2 [Phlebotomus argentipes]|uniref:interferon-related developmental regulator 2 n=1 Tax=Phlebotomus argentipes TaxID=94469 RepID=UPI002892DE5C|nr:interferon-related developmental regulator 2 [Phlebotomus argentipes]
MPKNKSKRGKGRLVELHSDDESINDNASIISMQSDECGGSLEDAPEDVGSVAERYEEKFMMALENCSEKSIQTRVTALQSASEILMLRFMPDTVDDRKMTLIDIIDKSLRRGKGAEQANAAKMAPLLSIQLAGDDLIPKGLNQTLIVTAQDNSVSYEARAKCCSALGLINFLSEDNIGDILSHMKNFESIFCGSFLKGDNTPSSASAEAAALHSAALGAWSLLLTLLPPGDFVSFMKERTLLPSLPNLMGMLRSPHLEVRMAAGEAIALALECGRVHDEEFMDEHLPELIEMTKQLATDSNKFRAKRDRKTQRATFRDVLRYIEEEVSPEINVKFGKETLVLNTWSIHHQYTAVCTAIGSGITIHLAENDFLRDVLQLGEKIITIGGVATKQSKLEKHLINAAAFKARTISRSKHRDKRSAVIN